MISSRTRRRSALLALTALLGITLTLIFAATAAAQVVSDPRIAEFDPSPDHWAVLDGGEPAVLRYELGVYMLGASTPFTTVDMGKRPPDADGKIRYDFSSAVAGWPLPGGNYEARVRAVGPEGAALSDPSNPFTFTAAPPCAISLNVTGAQVPASGGSYAVDVSAGPGCAWTASTALPWVTVLTAGGSGSGMAAFTVQANASSSSRTGTLTIGSKTLTLVQDAASSSTPRTTPTVSWAAPAPINQGTALNATQLNATASVPGTFVYTPAAGTVLAAGTHTLRVTFTPADTTRYTTATASATLVVTAPRTTPVLTWRAPYPITQGTPLSATQLNATASVPGTFVYTPAAGTVLAAGTRTLRVTFTPADTARYTTATASASIVVTAPRTTPVLTWPAPASITAGTALSATQLNATASVAGTFVYAPAAGTVLAAGTHALRVTFTPTDTTHYSTATASTTLVVTAPRTTPVLTWRAPYPITQGTPLSATQLNATASVPGTFVYTPAAGTVLAAGTRTLRVTFTPADTARYTTAAASASIVVTAPRTTPTVSWAAPAPINQGTALSATQLNATASVAGTFVYAPAAGTVLAAGTHTLRVTFTPADTTRYTTATASASILVVAAASPHAEGAATASATAAVDPQVFRLTVVRPAGGTISAAGITCGTGGTDCTETMAVAVWIGLRATPDHGYTFTSWTGDCVGNDPSYSLALAGPRTCGATFTAAR